MKLWEKLFRMRKVPEGLSLPPSKAIQTAEESAGAASSFTEGAEHDDYAAITAEGKSIV